MSRFHRMWRWCLAAGRVRGDEVNGIWRVEEDLYRLWRRATGGSRLGLHRSMLCLGIALMVLADVLLPLAGVRRERAYWVPSLVFLPAILGYSIWLLRAPFRAYRNASPLTIRGAGFFAVAGFWLVPVDILYDALITGYLEHTYLGLLGLSLIGMGYLVGLRHLIERTKAES